MKELRTVDEMISMYGKTVAHGVLGFLQDNMSVVAILTNYTTRSPEMMKILDQIITNLTMMDIELRLFYCNTKLMPADWFSRDANKGDWQLRPEIANQYMHTWGVCTVDRFADFQNALLPRFNAAYPCLGSEALDAMTQFWGGERNWINPPWAMLGKILFKLRSTPSAAATLLIPHWPSAVWWPRRRRGDQEGDGVSGREFDDLRSEGARGHAGSRPGRRRDVLAQLARDGSGVVIPSWVVSVQDDAAGTVEEGRDDDLELLKQQWPG